MIHRTAWALIVAGALLSACGTTVPAEAPPISADTYQARRLDQPELLALLQQTGATPKAVKPATWQLKQLYWAAMYFNPSLAEARAQVEVISAAERTANQRQNPTFSIVPTYDNSVSPIEWLLGVGLGIPVETNGKRGLRTSAAELQTQAATWQAVNTAWNVRNAVLSSLIDRSIASRTMRTLEALVKTQATLVAEYDERTTQGQIPSAFASQAQISYQQARLQLEQWKTLRSQADVALANAIGVPVAALAPIHIDDTIPSPVIVTNRKRTIERHPLLRAAMADYHAAHRALELEVAKQVPDINIGPGYEWNSDHGGKYSFALTFTLPIFNNNEGPIGEAVAKRTLAARHYETIQAQVINQLERAMADKMSADRARDVAHSIVMLQKDKTQRLKRMIVGNDAGEIPLLYADAEVLNAQLGELAAEAQSLKASAALEDAMRQPIFGAVINPHAFVPKKED